MFFAPKDAMSVSPIQQQTIIENANRSLFCYAQARLRAGDVAEATLLCNQLRARSAEQGDSLHYYASGRLLSSLSSRASESGEGASCIGSESMEAHLQDRFAVAVACYLRKDYREARAILEGICDSIGSRKNLTIYTASVYSWLASAIRNEWLQTPRAKANTAFQLERKWKKVVAIAVKVSGRFEEEKSHAYREYAWHSAIHDGPHHANAVLSALRYSVTVAQRLGMTQEEKQTLHDWNQLTTELELNVPAMESAELARWRELCPAQEPLCNHCLHPENCTCASETDIELEVTELRQVFAASLETVFADHEPILG
jgi:hypothetical protein